MIPTIVTKTAAEMPNLTPGTYCAIVDMAERWPTRVGRAQQKWEDEPPPDPQEGALEQFVGIAAAAWPGVNSGFVNVWVEITP